MDCCNFLPTLSNIRGFFSSRLSLCLNRNSPNSSCVILCQGSISSIFDMTARYIYEYDLSCWKRDSRVLNNSSSREFYFTEQRSFIGCRTLADSMVRPIENIQDQVFSLLSIAPNFILTISSGDRQPSPYSKTAFLQADTWQGHDNLQATFTFCSALRNMLRGCKSPT